MGDNWVTLGQYMYIVVSSDLSWNMRAQSWAELDKVHHVTVIVHHGGELVEWYTMEK